MRNPYLDSTFSVGQKQWHLVLGVEPKVVNRVLLAFLQINCLNAKIPIRFGQCDVRYKRINPRFGLRVAGIKSWLTVVVLPQ
jgi:hypothetical protein